MIFGGICATTGLIYLALAVNLLTSVIGAVTLVSYLFIYTPLKRMTWLNTAVGAVPGALPPLMGWTAARGELSGEGWALFAILALWQMPHFMAIAWIYRADYAKAGFKMLPVVDPDGCRTGEQAVSHALALLFVSLCPFVFKMAGAFYLAGALVLGAGYLWFAFQFFAATPLRTGGIDPGARAAVVSGVHHLSAVAAGGDGFGQAEITWKNWFILFRHSASTRLRTAMTTMRITIRASGAPMFFRPTTRSSASNTVWDRCASCCLDFS